MNFFKTLTITLSLAIFGGIATSPATAGSWVPPPTPIVSLIHDWTAVMNMRYAQAQAALHVNDMKTYNDRMYRYNSIKIFIIWCNTHQPWRGGYPTNDGNYAQHCLDTWNFHAYQH